MKVCDLSRKAAKALMSLVYWRKLHPLINRSDDTNRLKNFWEIPKLGLAKQSGAW